MNRFRTLLLAGTIAFAAFVLGPLGCAPNADDDHSETSDNAHAETHDATTDAVSEESETTALHRADPVGNYGAGVVMKESVALAAIVDAPETYENQAVQVRAAVKEVCPMRGCWIDLESADGAALRVKVTDGEIVFPLSAKGHDATVEGVLERIDMDEEEYRAWKAHEAEELGVYFDPNSVTGPGTKWQIRGTGAQIDS